MKRVSVILVIAVIFGINAVAENKFLDYLDDVGICMEKSLDEVVESSGHDFGATAASVIPIAADCIDGEKDADWTEEFETNSSDN